MIHNLPTHKSSWKRVEDFTPEKIGQVVKKDKNGYLLEVDVEYAKELHKNHNELLFLAEKMKIGREQKVVPNLNRRTHQRTESSIKALKI